jgi:uncharacterized protein (DUF2141 family)
MSTSLALLSLLALLAVPAPSQAAAIDVAVTNVTSTKGRIHVDICPQAKFLKEDCPYSAEAPATVGTTVVTVPDVPPGRYAAQVFHDRNNNGKVDRALFGIPTEPLGFSRDAPVRMRPPKFADAAFDHGSERQRITLALRSFL